MDDTWAETPISSFVLCRECRTPGGQNLPSSLSFRLSIGVKNVYFIGFTGSHPLRHHLMF